jgi:hypothetical protein
MVGKTGMSCPYQCKAGEPGSDMVDSCKMCRRDATDTRRPRPPTMWVYMRRALAHRGFSKIVPVENMIEIVLLLDHATASSCCP